MIQQAVANILDYHLRAPAGQRVTIVYPQEKADLAEALARGLSERGAHPRLLFVPDDAPNLPPAVREAFADANIGLIVLLSHAMWSRQGLARYFLMRDGQPSLDVRPSPLFVDTVIARESFLRIYASDPQEDRAYLESLRQTLPESTTVRVTAPGGTDLTFRSRDWQLCGLTEVLTAPAEGSAEGVIVADLSVFYGLVSSPIELQLEGGRLVSMRCPDPTDRLFRMYVEEMERRFDEGEANRRLAEAGVGGNGGARPSGVLMEDEAVRGTCHFCFGDNTRYGGTNASDWHGGTVVVREPRFTVG
jgi:leucyl aminopeptidase (aminopeptidase T)